LSLLDDRKRSEGTFSHFAAKIAAKESSQNGTDMVPIYASPDAKILLYMAQAVKTGKLKIPIDRKLPLQDAEQGHAAVAKSGAGKFLLIADKE
jgi:NADPH:quinone reductase-like Zn-dependent oxidoreductase